MEEEPQYLRGTPVPRGDRILSIDITTAENGDYDDAFCIARSAGIQATSLSLCWDEIETAPMTYHNELLANANAYYPRRDTSISLTISPIDTSSTHIAFHRQ